MLPAPVADLVPVVCAPVNINYNEIRSFIYQLFNWPGPRDDLKTTTHQQNDRHWQNTCALVEKSIARNARFQVCCLVSQIRECFRFWAEHENHFPAEVRPAGVRCYICCCHYNSKWKDNTRSCHACALLPLFSNAGPHLISVWWHGERG